MDQPRREIRRPGRAELAGYAASEHITLAPEALEAELSSVSALLAVFERLDELDSPSAPAPGLGRDPGRRPTDTEDPFNAIARFCEVTGAGSGPLAGVRVGVKDTIAVAGIPWRGGAESDDGSVPGEDAIVVERLLDAGATIVAKTNFTGSGLGETLNPLDPRFSAGASSSGSAAAVASKQVDLALGADQAGSVRWPAAWCGLVGMKATHGLVPTYGLIYSDHTIDTIGPITTTVAENAAVLDVIAGPDPRDPVNGLHPPAERRSTESLGRSVRGLRAAVVIDSLAASGCTASTLAAFEHARRICKELGLEVVDVAIPLWSSSFAIWLGNATFNQSALADAYGQGYGHFGAVDVDRILRSAAAQLSGKHQPRTLLLAREHLRNVLPGVHYAKAQNLRTTLRQQVDRILTEVDVLLTPTSPTGPIETPTHSIDLAELATRSPAARRDSFIQGSPILTCSPFNLTGHPAMTIPSGLAGNDGLPRGLQLAGRRFSEQLLYQIGFALVQRLTGAG